MNRLKAKLQKIIDTMRGAKPPADKPYSVNSIIAGSSCVVTLRMESGQQHIYRWPLGRGADMRIAIARAIYERRSMLTWKDAAMVNCAIRKIEQGAGL